MAWQATVLLLIHLGFIIPSMATLAYPNALPGCPSKCGNVTVPYPFGTKPGCHAPCFLVTCNEETGSPPTPMVNNSNVQILDINLLEGQVRINHFTSHDCYARNGTGFSNKRTRTSINIDGLPYTFSDTRNKFIAVGCDTRGFLIDRKGRFTTGCVSFCNSAEYVQNGTCSGIGCCSTPIPKGLRTFNVRLNSQNNHSKCLDFNPCSYGFLVDEDLFHFNLSSFAALKDVTYMPVTVDWAVGNLTCEVAKSNDDFMCVAEKSYCYDSTNGPGYRCNCTKGYHGNPYLKGGCVDIDECSSPDTNDCAPGYCHDSDGGYECKCPSGHRGDGKKNGSGCRSIFPLIQVVLGTGFGTLFAIVAGSWLFWFYKKKRLMELKEKFFLKNGGFLLQQQFSLEGTGAAARLFTAGELEKATDNYHESRILGQGGFGTVYKGVLPDQSVVAIKKSKITAECEIEQFINEVVVLSHTNHRNVVKLLGCCLETNVPMLVYEFVPNGTLAHHLHGTASLSLDSRLRIASETAGALAYLHTAAAMPIIHRDVKSANILLDDNYTAKVADFGASRLVPFDKNGLTSLVRGTVGYLDPEYFHTAQFTDKSDVYSFGVVLVELLTGQKPILTNKASENRNIATHFISLMKTGRMFEVLESRVVAEGSPELLLELAQLVKRCLRLSGEERPTMKEVAMELEGLRRYSRHPWVAEKVEEGDGLLGDDAGSIGSGGGDSSSSFTMSYGTDDSASPILLALDMVR